MRSERTPKILRALERTLVLLLSFLGVVIVLQYTRGAWVENEIFIAGAVELVLFIILLITQYRFDRWLDVAGSQLRLGSEGAFLSLYEHSPMPYLTVRKSGVIEEWNPAALHFLEAEGEQLRGLNFLSFIESSDGEETGSLLAGKMSGGVLVNDKEMHLKTLSGKSVWVLVSMYVHQGTNDRLISLVDVTEKKKIDTAKSEFVALATHQLRTPVAAIRWNTELLKGHIKDALNEDQLKYFEKIERNTKRMIVLINDFLSVSKLEMGTFATTSEPVDLTVFIDGVIEEFAGTIKQKSITVHREEIPAQLSFKSDPRLLHIAISNLISNAVKYSHQNGNVWVRYQAKGSRLRVVIADDGIGIPEKELANLFVKFYRASNAQLHQAEGTGLGLYVVKQSIEMLGGVITVDSSKDNGARFEIALSL